MGCHLEIEDGKGYAPKKKTESEVCVICLVIESDFDGICSC